MSHIDIAEIKKFTKKLSYITKYELTINDKGLRSEVKGEVQKIIKKLNTISSGTEKTGVNSKCKQSRWRINEHIC